MAKRRYHIVRKQQADFRALLRGLVAAYLLFLTFQLTASSDSGFPLMARFLAGGLFAIGAIAFGWFTWKQYRAALNDAVLTPEELAELERDGL